MRTGVYTLPYATYLPLSAEAVLRCRQQYANMVPATASEGIVCSPDGQLLEGFLSNLFIVQRDENGLIVRTAVDRVLAGIKQREVLDACEALHIRVDRSAPLKQDRHLWVEAFLTNAVRGIRPVNHIVCPAHNALGWEPWDIALLVDVQTSVSSQLQDHLQRCKQDLLLHIWSP